MLAIYFDTSYDVGHKTHYFHFLHGYLLPGLQLALHLNVKQVWFEYCGPLMQPRIQEACDLLSIKLIPHTTDPKDMSSCLAPRWDKTLLYFNNPPLSDITCILFKENCKQLKTKLLSAAQSLVTLENKMEKWKGLDVIVFQRSQQHPFYPTIDSKYGRARRELKNEEDIVHALQKKGLKALNLDMGQLTFAEQIVACNSAKVVLGIRGAEFANLIWMKEGSTALMLTNPIARENNGTRSLAKIFKQTFLTYPVEKNKVHLKDMDIQNLVEMIL